MKCWLIIQIDWLPPAYNGGPDDGFGETYDWEVRIPIPVLSEIDE